MEDGKKSGWSYSRFERRIFPEWLFQPENEEFRRIAIIAYPTVLVAIIALLILGSLALLGRDRILGLVDLSFAFLLAGFLHYHRKSKVRNDLVNHLGVVVFGFFCFYLFFFSGVHRPTFLWSYIFPLATFPILGSRRGLVAVILFLAPIFSLLVLDPPIHFMTSYPRDLTFLFIPSILIVSGLSYLYEKNRESNHRQLRQANIALQQSSEEMERRVMQRTAELAHSEGQYRLLTEKMSDMVWTADLNLNITFVSPSVEKMLGYTPEEYSKRPFHERVTPESFNKAMTLFATELERDKMFGADPERSIQVEVECYRKDGSTMWMESLMNAIRDPEGNLMGVHGVSRDITERKLAEETHRELEERLNRAEKMKALGTLAGGVAHDLNNVLSPVVGFAELLLDEVDRASPMRRRLENILDGGEKAAAIVQDLLTLARRGVPSRKVINLNAAVTEYQKSPEFARLSSQHPSVLFKVDLEPDLLNISGSSIHLEKTLYNLVSNAAESMPKGGTLTMRTSNHYLDKPIRGYDEVKEGDYVVLSVSDTGEGIPAADMKSIFEPFYTKKVMGRSGTGLGLAVVWGTVKDHSGYIDVRSEEGKGSTFTLYFPVTRDELAEGQMRASISEYLGHGESILVVDDVDGQRDLAIAMLGKLNYNVVAVSSGVEAVAYLKENEMDLVVLDMIMDPGMDGLDTYRKIIEIRPGQKAIIVSGFAETERVRQTQALGAGPYVRKPYILERIGLVVRRELDRSTPVKREA